MNRHPDSPLPPSVLAAKRGLADGRTVSRDRAYPPPAPDDDVQAIAVQLGATRALLEASTPEQVAAVVATLVRDLGGGLVPARLAEASVVMPLDVSFGLTEPLLPWAEPVSVSAMRLARVLPDVMADARAVCDRLQRDSRSAQEAQHDSLTGLLTRRAWMRRLSSARPADAVCLIDLDRFTTVNDSAGHAAGDEVLRAVGLLLLGAFRPSDACGRYGGVQLACLATALPAETLACRMDDVRRLWQERRPAVGADVGLSVGVAQVGDREPRAALEAADRALSRTKAAGRDATAVATAQDDDSRRPS